jgi:hypothetical protein
MSKINMSYDIDFSHMRHDAAEIIKGQIVILRALAVLIPHCADLDIVEEIEGKIQDLNEFYWGGRYKEFDTDHIKYADRELNPPNAQS